MHIKNIYRDGELQESSTNKKFLLVQKEGNREVKRNIDMIIALGYRVGTKRINEEVRNNPENFFWILTSEE